MRPHESMRVCGPPGLAALRHTSVVGKMVKNPSLVDRWEPYLAFGTWLAQPKRVSGLSPEVR